MAALWFAGIVIASLVTLIFLRLLLLSGKARTTDWHLRASIVLGLAGSVFLLVNQLNAYRQHAYRITGDGFVIGGLLLLCSLFTARKSLTGRRS